MKVDLDGLDLTSICSTAIVQSLDDAKREQMIKEAISYLLTPKGSYGRETSPLQQAFQDAMRVSARKWCESEFIKDGELDERIASVIREAVARAFNAENREKMVEKLTDQIVSGLRIDNW